MEGLYNLVFLSLEEMNIYMWFVIYDLKFGYNIKFIW